MLAASIMADSTISGNSKVVLMALRMEAFGKPTITASQGLLAKACGISRSRVQQCLQELENAGLITKVPNPKTQVVTYQLAPGDAPQSLPEAKTLRKSTKTLHPCLECRKLCRPSPLTGWCRRCTNDKRLLHKLKAALRSEQNEQSVRTGQTAAGDQTGELSEAEVPSSLDIGTEIPPPPGTPPGSNMVR